MQRAIPIFPFSEKYNDIHYQHAKTVSYECIRLETELARMALLMADLLMASIPPLWMM